MKRKDTKNETESESNRTNDGDGKTSRSSRRSDRVTSLHRTVGNQAVQQLYRQGQLQASLTVSQPGDESEREAERVAEQVMRMSPTESAVRPRRTGGVQRKGSSDGSSVDGEAKRQIESVTSGGKPLSESARSYFEPRFGQDFSDVRVHTGPKADEAARSINAEAFTHGTDVVFRSGKHDPDSRNGKRLMAHELTHVTQQDGRGGSPSRVQRQSSGRSGGQSKQSGEGVPGGWQVLDQHTQGPKKLSYRIPLNYNRTWNIAGQSLGIRFNAHVDIFPKAQAVLKNFEINFNGGTYMTMSPRKFGPKDVSKLNAGPFKFKLAKQQGGRQPKAGDRYWQLSCTLKLLKWILGRLTTKTADMKGKSMASPGDKKSKTYKDAKPGWLTLKPKGNVGINFRFGEGGESFEVQGYDGKLALKVGAKLTKGTKANIKLSFSALTKRGESTAQLKPTEENVTSATVSAEASATVSIFGYEWSVGTGPNRATSEGTFTEYAQFRRRAIASGILKTMQNLSPEAIREAESSQAMSALVDTINSNFVGNANRALVDAQRLLGGDREYESIHKIIGANLITPKGGYAGYTTNSAATPFISMAAEHDSSITEKINLLESWAPPHAVEAPWSGASKPRKTATWNVANYMRWEGRPTIMYLSRQFNRTHDNPREGGRETARKLLEEVNYIFNNYSEAAIKEMRYYRSLMEVKRMMTLYLQDPQAFNEQYVAPGERGKSAENKPVSKPGPSG